MTNACENEESLIILLDKITNLSDDEMQNGPYASLVDQLLAEEEYVIYSLVKFLVVNYRRTGILKSYRKKDLLDCLKWRKTQLDYYLDQATKQNVLNKTKTKFSLNLENILVQRIWNYYFHSTNFENLSITKMIETTSTMKQRQSLDKEIQAMKLLIESKKREQENGDFKAFMEEIHSITNHDCDHKELIRDLCKKSLSDFV